MRVELSRLRMTSRAPYALVALPLVVLVLAVAALQALPYSTCLIDQIDVEEVEAAPNPDFTLGILRWEVRHYAADPKLDPLRAYYRQVCGGGRGLSAAMRLSRALATRSPIGRPSSEFFEPSYDPAAMLRDQVRGGAGHCVSRAGTIAAVLLSVGIPARVVQILPLDPSGELRLAYGHNILEVWDDQHGWALVDPTFGGIVGELGRPCSAARMIRSRGGLKLIDFDQSWGKYIAPHGYYARELQHGLLMNYPEPWLYVRVGPRSVPAPFRGRFACAGGWHWQLGPAQNALRSTVFIDILASLAVGAVVAGKRLLVPAARRERAAAPVAMLAEPDGQAAFL